MTLFCETGLKLKRPVFTIIREVEALFYGLK